MTVWHMQTQSDYNTHSDYNTLNYKQCYQLAVITDICYRITQSTAARRAPSAIVITVILFCKKPQVTEQQNFFICKQLLSVDYNHPLLSICTFLALIHLLVPAHSILLHQ